MSPYLLEIDLVFKKFFFLNGFNAGTKYRVDIEYYIFCSKLHRLLSQKFSFIKIFKAHWNNIANGLH